MKHPQEHTKYREQLRAKGFRATKLRLFLLQLFAQSPRSFSIDALYHIIGADQKVETPNWASIYRVVNDFRDAGLIFSFKAGKKDYFEYQSQRDEPRHHHHLICTHCDQVIHLAGCHASELNQMVQEFSFKNIQHQLDFFGLCPACQ